MSLEPVIAWVDSLSAADAAEFFLSPHVDPRLLCQATVNDGPSLWIVNRSDVYDATLEALLQHPLASIRLRAQEKLSQRKSSLTLLEPPEIDVAIQDIPDFAIEDYLGHPLAPFELILFFMKHLNADVRASACLSLTRRLVEHAPNWAGHEAVKMLLIERSAERLLDESSDFVRLYASRIPVQSASALHEAFKKESHPMIRRRLLQNPATSVDLCRQAIETSEASFETSIVVLLDRRVAPQTSIKTKDLSDDQIAILKAVSKFRSQL